MFRCLTMTAVALATLLGLGFSASVGAEETVYCKRVDGIAYVRTSDSAACYGEDDKSIAKAEYEWWLNNTSERAEAAFQAHDYATAKNLYYDLYNSGGGPQARAAHMLSVLLYQPFPGIEQDRSKAYELHQLALRKNDKLAQENEQEFKKKAFKTADIYEDLGEIGMRDDELAEKAMELCFLYSRGWGVEINFAEARRWCIEAGKKGHPDADKFSMFVDNAYDVQKVSGLPFCRNHFMTPQEINELVDSGKAETELHNCLVAKNAYNWEVSEYRNGDKNGIHTSLGMHNDGCLMAEYGNYVDNSTFVGSMIVCNIPNSQPGEYYLRGTFKLGHLEFTGRLIGPDGVMKTGLFSFLYGVDDEFSLDTSELWNEELEWCVKDGPGSRQTHGKYTGGSALWLGLSEQDKKFQCALRLGSLSLQELWDSE